MDDNFVYVGLTTTLGSDLTGSVDYDADGSSKRLSARISKSRPLGVGYGYSVRAGMEDGDVDGNMSFTYAGPFGTYTAGYRRLASNDTFLAATAGSVSWIDGGVYASRPVQSDSFLLVRTSGVEGVDIRLNNQAMGKSNSVGELLVPRPAPYIGNRITINDQGLPLNYELGNLEQLATTPYKGGGVVDFKVRRIQGFTGVIYILEKGESVPAEYWGLRYLSEGQQVETIVGRSGNFYVENLPPGRSAAVAFVDDKACEFTFEAPDHSEMLVELGEITCEIAP